MRPRFLRVMLTTLVLSMLLASVQAQADEIRIGFLVPRTGVFAGIGELALEGATLALEEHNYQVNGIPVRFIVEDSRLSGEVAVDRSRKLDEQDRVHLIVGPLSGGEGLAVHDWARGSGVPVIVYYSAPEDMTMRQAIPNLVRNSWTGAQPMDPFGYYLASELGYRRIYIVSQDYSFPHNQMGGFKRGFCRAGGELVTGAWHTVPTEDFSSIIARIPRTGFDAVLYNGGGSDAAQFVRQYVEFGMLDVLPLLGTSNTFEPDALITMPSEIVGALGAMQFVETLQTPEAVAFRERFTERWGRRPSAGSEHAYTAVVMALRALATLDDVNDRAAIISALQGFEYPDAPRGGFYLDDFGNAVHNIFIREVREIGGELVNVAVVRVPNVSQFGPYDPDVYMAQPIDARAWPPDACADMPAEYLDVEETYEFIPMDPID